MRTGNYLIGAVLSIVIASGFRITQRETLTIPQFKRILKNTLEQEASGDRVFTVSGYYFSERGPMLITDPGLMRTNKLIPDSAYIRLNGKGVDSIAGSTQYPGAYVRVRLCLNNRRIVVLQRPIILRREGDR